MVQQQLKWYIISASILVIVTGILEAARADEGQGGAHGGLPRSIPKKGKFPDNPHEEPRKRHHLNPKYAPSEHTPVFGGGSRTGDDGGLGIGYGNPTTRRPTTTEPDWDYICYVLCGEGDGGAACDCDILPIG